jgi:hypothetical protein
VEFASVRLGPPSTIECDSMTFEDVLRSVWRQALVDGADRVRLGEAEFRVRHTSRGHLAQVDFKWEGRDLRGLEQNQETKSRWAQLARAGKSVMQFLENGRYVAVVVDGKVTLYGGAERN